MEIKFSRHAKRRRRLYNIPEEVIIEILERQELVEGEHEIVEDIEGFKYPIKIVVSVKGNRITVITNYPLKKRRKK